MSSLFDFEDTHYFLGAGIGRLEVPKPENDSGGRFKDDLYNLEVGVRVRPFKRIGFYAAAKFLNAQKKIDGQKVIDFNESILLLGITYSFGF